MGQHWKGSIINTIKKTKQTNDQQLVLENKNAKIRSNERTSIPCTEGASCNEATQIDHPLTVKATKLTVYPKI
jgi:hypothetical protein